MGQPEELDNPHFRHLYGHFRPPLFTVFYPGKLHTCARAGAKVWRPGRPNPSLIPSNEKPEAVQDRLRQIAAEFV